MLEELLKKLDDNLVNIDSLELSVEKLKILYEINDENGYIKINDEFINSIKNNKKKQR